MSKTPINTLSPLRVLLLEDSESDAGLIREQLCLGGFEPAVTHVMDEAAFVAALERTYDIILTDYSLPQFTALEALRLLRQRGSKMPVIVVSGSIGEERAVECIKEGASDYLLKDRLGRLGSAVTFALQHQELIHTHRIAQDRLRSSDAQVQHLLEHSPAVIYLVRYDGEHEVPVLVSENLMDLLGFSSTEAVGANWWADQLHPKDREKAVSAREAVRREGEVRCEYRIRHRNGTYRWVEDRLRLFRDETGTPKEIVGLWSDVTARKEAETAIVQVEKRADRIRLITGIVITTGLAVVIFSLGVGLDLFVPLLRWILQHRDTVVDEIVGSFLFICLATLFYAAWMLRATQTEVGAHRKVEAALQLLHDELESRVQNRTSELTRTNETLRAEIAERQRTQAALSEERALMRTLIDQIPDSIYIKDRNQRFVLANQGAAQVLGVASPAELLGKHDRELFPSAQAETFAADDERVIKGDAIFNQEESLLALDGKERTLLTTKFPLRDLTGNITGLVGIGRDITARKRLETELLRAQRVESIGRLASGIAHDMNNILAPIMMSASLLRTPRLAPKAVETTLQTIESSAKRGADLVKQLLLFGRGGEGGRGVVNFRKMVDELASIARETFPRNIVFKTEVPANLWTVEADATQLHQVLLNLCVNARDAMPSGGTLTVGASNVTLDEAACRPHPAASPGPYLCVTVSDTGTGIPPEIAAKIFEPFFTTKEIGRGTGLGLATVLSVMEAHAGFISLESEIGRGTCFRLHLPAKPNAKEAMEKGSGASPAGRGELILVVDDERYIREIISQILLTHNYRVIEASDGVEALALFAQHPEVDLLLTDIDMPNLDGIGLVERLRQQKPTLPIVVSSGLADAKNNALRQEQLQPYGLSQILAKPCTKDQVLHRIAEELNAAAESIRSPTGVVTRG